MQVCAATDGSSKSISPSLFSLSFATELVAVEEQWISALQGRSLLLYSCNLKSPEISFQTNYDVICLLIAILTQESFFLFLPSTLVNVLKN